MSVGAAVVVASYALFAEFAVAETNSVRFVIAAVVPAVVLAKA